MADMVKFRPHKNPVVITIAVIVLLAAAGVAGVLVRNAQTPADKKEDAGEVTAANLGRPLEGAAEEAQNLRTAGDTAGSAKVISDALNNKATPAEERYILYIQQGNLASESQNNAAAIEAYLQAEKVKQTYEVTSLLAETYKSAGNTAKAIEYYKKALPLVPDSPMKDADKARIQEKIRALEGQS